MNAKKLKGLALLMRPNAWPVTVFSLSIGAILAIYPSKPSFSQLETLFFLCITFACFIASGLYVLNDVFDRNLDRKNPIKRKRPIASGAVSVREGLAFSLCLLAIGLFLALEISLFHLLLGLVLVGLQLAYSVPPVRLKETSIDFLFSGPLNHLVRIIAAWVLFKPLAQIPLLVSTGLFLLYCTAYIYYKLIDKKFIPLKSVAKRKNIIPAINCASGFGILLIIASVLLGEVTPIFISVPAVLIAVWALQLIIPATKKIPFLHSLVYVYGPAGLTFATISLWVLAMVF